MSNRDAHNKKATFRLLLLQVLAFLPLVIRPDITVNFDDIYLLPKLWWLYLVIFPLTAININFPVLYRSYKNRILLLLIFLVSIITSVFYHSNLEMLLGITGRSDGVLMHILYVLIALATMSLYTEDKETTLSYLVHSYLILGIIAAISNILQQFHLVGIIGEGAFTGTVATKMGGLLGNRGYLGGLLALLLPLACVALTQKLRWKWLAPLAVLLITWAWLGSYTRSAWLAGAMSLVVLFIYKPGVIRWSFPYLTTALLIFLPVNFIFDNGRGFDTEDGESIISKDGRRVLWSTALYGIQQKPLFGWGDNALARAMNSRAPQDLFREHGTKDIVQYRKTSVEAIDIPQYIVWHTKTKPEIVTVADTNKVHNEYLEYALNYGVLSAVLFFALLVLGIFSSLKPLPGLSAALVAYAVYLLTWPDVIRIAPIAWSILGIALAARQDKTRHTDS